MFLFDINSNSIFLGGGGVVRMCIFLLIKATF